MRFLVKFNDYTMHVHNSCRYLNGHSLNIQIGHHRLHVWSVMTGNIQHRFYRIYWPPITIFGIATTPHHNGLHIVNPIFLRKG
ncbi:uncharacterized protein METZ01_LOCUS271579, partial [marine metagenome]